MKHKRSDVSIEIELTWLAAPTNYSAPTQKQHYVTSLMEVYFKYHTTIVFVSRHIQNNSHPHNTSLTIPPQQFLPQTMPVLDNSKYSSGGSCHG